MRSCTSCADSGPLRHRLVGATSSAGDAFNSIKNTTTVTARYYFIVGVGKMAFRTAVMEETEFAFAHHVHLSPQGQSRRGRRCERGEPDGCTAKRFAISLHPDHFTPRGQSGRGEARLRRDKLPRPTISGNPTCSVSGHFRDQTRSSGSSRIWGRATESPPASGAPAGDCR